MKSLRTFGLSSNLLKIIGALTMLVDHIGVIMFPQVKILRIIGRIAFPIFAFLISEGCRYTKNKKVYFFRMLILGLATSVVYCIVQKEIYLDTLMTFSFSIIIIFLIQEVQNKNSTSTKKICCLFALSLLIFALYILTQYVTVDYGFWGIMLPVFPALFVNENNNNRLLICNLRFCFFAVGLILMSIIYFKINRLQIYSLFSLVLLAMYNGEKGFKLPKYFFYIFYPAHIAVIWLVDFILKM